MGGRKKEKRNKDVGFEYKLLNTEMTPCNQLKLFRKLLGIFWFHTFDQIKGLACIISRRCKNVLTTIIFQFIYLVVNINNETVLFFINHKITY